jgi:hypothetical protein
MVWQVLWPRCPGSAGSAGTCSGPGTICSNNLCVACGGPGSACCPGSQEVGVYAPLWRRQPIGRRGMRQRQPEQRHGLWRLHNPVHVRSLLWRRNGLEECDLGMLNGDTTHTACGASVVMPCTTFGFSPSVAHRPAFARRWMKEGFLAWASRSASMRRPNSPALPRAARSRKSTEASISHTMRT